MKTAARRLAAWLLGTALLGALASPAPLAFAGVEVGGAVEDEELPALGGGRQALLGKAKASVFVFFRPNQDHSTETLRQLAALEKEFAGRPVHFAAVVSDSWPAAEVKAVVDESGIRMPVLLDAGDALYGKLGVRLHPVVGIADGQHRLAAYQPFEKINQTDVLRVRIRRVLGEATDAEVERVVSPPRATMPGDDVRYVAKRDVNLGKVFLEKKGWEKALESARKAQQRDPTFAGARVLSGQALAGMGRCAEATAEFDAALLLDPKDAAAQSGRAACAGR